MALSALDQQLQNLLKFRKTQVGLLKNGVRIQAIGATTIEDLMLRACADRFALSEHFLATATRLRRMRPASYRDATSRSYYSMYHAARAVSYVCEDGDDHQEHNELHKGIPVEFPDADLWKNNLKDARTRRNDADYDPYPKPDNEFADISRVQLQIATDFLGIAKVFLRAKGCPL